MHWSKRLLLFLLMSLLFGGCCRKRHVGNVLAEHVNKPALN